MADDEEFLSVTVSNENPIGQTNSYVVAQHEINNSVQQIIDPSRTSDHNPRETQNDSFYNNSRPFEDYSRLEDEQENIVVTNPDLKSSSAFLPRLVFLDSDENISSDANSNGLKLSENGTESRQQRSVSDSAVRTGEVQDSFGRLTPLPKQPQGNSYTGYSNRLSQVSVQSSDSDLLMDHNVIMEAEQDPVNMKHLIGARRISADDDDWHCHLRNSKMRPDKTARNQLIIVSILCFIFMIGEAIGGALSNSLALFTDVLHLGSDLISFLVSLLALYLSRKPANKSMSFGYHRAEVLGALMSVFIIWSVTGVLIYMAIERIINEHYKDVKADEMLITAILGVVFNFVMGIVLHSELCCKGLGHNHSHGSSHSHSHGNHTENHSNQNNSISKRSSTREDESRVPLLDNGNDIIQINDITDSVENHEENAHPKNINVRAAFIHVVGDIIQSIGVLVSSLIIKFKPEEKYRLADPICTFLFSLLVLLTTITVLRDTLQIIMEGVPRDLNYYAIKTRLQKIEGVVSVHGLSLWCLTLEKNALTVHLAVNPNISQKAVLQEASEYLHKNYNFLHTTIQVEDHTEHTAHCTDCQEVHK